MAFYLYLFVEYPESRQVAKLIYSFLGIVLVYMFWVSNTYSISFVVDENGIDNRGKISFLFFTLYRNQIGKLNWEDISYIDYWDWGYVPRVGFVIQTNKKVKISYFLFTPIISNRKKAMKVIANHVSRDKFSDKAVARLAKMRIVVSCSCVKN